ncbi:MAG: hypothetical protein ABSH51_26420 [Solirubrobacteraceae bacterium]
MVDHRQDRDPIALADLYPDRRLRWRVHLRILEEVGDDALRGPLDRVKL